jgi:hypothetical protein
VGCGCTPNPRIGKTTPGTTTGTSPSGACTVVVTRQAIDRDGLRLPVAVTRTWQPVRPGVRTARPSHQLSFAIHTAKMYHRAVHRLRLWATAIPYPSRGWDRRSFFRSVSEPLLLGERVGVGVEVTNPAAPVKAGPGWASAATSSAGESHRRE